MQVTLLRNDGHLMNITADEAARVRARAGVDESWWRRLERKRRRPEHRFPGDSFDRFLHDLRSEFIVREGKLRDEYLAERPVILYQIS
jgi:type VI protein secretion system component VasK